MFGVKITWPYVLFSLLMVGSLSYGANVDADALIKSIRVYGNIGTMSEFQLHGDWPIYQDRLEQYFAANMIEPDRRVAVLLTSIGDQTYKILRDICDPVSPSSKTYQELINILKNQFSPRTSVFRSRILFYSLMQTPEETVNEWYIRIKSNALPCKFGNALDSIVKDKFVSGLLRGPILDKLCEENHEKTTNELLEIALIKEANMKPIEEDPNRRPPVEDRKQNKKHTNSGLCFSCGKRLLQTTSYTNKQEVITTHFFPAVPPVIHSKVKDENISNIDDDQNVMGNGDDDDVKDKN